MSKNQYKDLITQAAKIIKQGGIIAYPTDTCYGLGADPKNKDAMKRLFDTKGRTKSKKVSLIFEDISMVEKYCDLNQKQKKYLIKYLPGPYTFILKAKHSTETIGIRIPNHKVTQLLSKYLKMPYTTTSANKSGQPPCYDAKCITGQLTGVDLILDGGKLPKNLPSKIIDLTKTPFEVLRI